MANVKISNLTAATTPVAGTEVLPIVQSGATVKVSIANLTPGLDTITAAKGGTGQTSYAVGDLLYASTTTALSKLADVATGNALISGGVSTAPSWGKIGLTTHVSGVLPTANGGTNLSSFTANGVVYASSTSALTTGSALVFDGTNLRVGTTSSLSVADKMTVVGGNFAVQRTSGITTYKGDNTADGYAGTATNQAFALLTNSVERARIDTSGNFGIGTSSPTGGANRVVDVYGSGSSAINFHNATSGTTATDGGLVGQYGSDLVLYNYEAGIIQFGTSNAERARIDSSGNLLVGTTSQIGVEQVGISFADSSKNGLGIQTQGSTSGAGFIAFRNSSGTNIGSVARVAATNAVVYNTTSDYRLKTVVGAVTGQGERIDALKPVDYQWKEDGQAARGFLAHEFAEVYANSVTGAKDAVDADGNPVYQAMQASTPEVIADLVAEIQSLRKRLAAANL